MCDDTAVIALDFLLDEGADGVSRPSALAKAAAKQLAAYFKNPAHQFDLPIALSGTSHALRVWNELRQIPSGRVETYGALAKRLKSGPRAVGNACRRNPIPILIPCHRVVRVSDQGGFMGATHGRCTDIKAWLIAHEAQKSRAE